VPEVLVSGHHEKIRAWRRAEAERLTRERRPDLWNLYVARAARGGRAAWNTTAGKETTP
jgi:tRNA (guanine37-N1)-methyltransferase